MLMGIVQFLEARGLEVKARALVNMDPEFRELLRPRRPGTTVRNCQMFRRFIKFYESLTYSLTPLRLDAHPRVD